MSAALGRLPNAPLAYVLAQVRFEPFLEIEKHIPALQTSLRDPYPRFRQLEQVGFQVLTESEYQPPRGTTGRISPLGIRHSRPNHAGDDRAARFRWCFMRRPMKLMNSSAKRGDG